jgi:hypothetical protein
MKVMVHWAKNEFKWGTPFSPTDYEPRLLVLDAFAPHKNTGPSNKKQLSEKAQIQADEDERYRAEFKNELAKLNTTTSIIPGGTTCYLQPCDLVANKLMKELIREQEEAYFEANPEKWEAEKFPIGERRVLYTFWVKTAYDILHEKYKDAIISCFRHIGLSLPPDGSKDYELKVRDMPNLTVGDFTRDEVVVGKLPSKSLYLLLIYYIEKPKVPAPTNRRRPAPSQLTSSPLHPLPFSLRNRPSRPLRSRSAYCTAKDVDNGYLSASSEEEDEGGVTTDTGSDIDHIIGSEDEVEFDPDRDGDTDYADENM